MVYFYLAAAQKFLALLKGKNMNEKSYYLTTESPKNDDEYFKEVYEGALDYIENHIAEGDYIDQRQGEFTKYYNAWQDNFPVTGRYCGTYGLNVVLKIGAKRKSLNFYSTCSVYIQQEEIGFFLIEELNKRGEELSVETIRQEILTNTAEHICSEINQIMRQKIDRIGLNAPGYRLLFELTEDPQKEIMEELELGYELIYDELDLAIQNLLEDYNTYQINQA